MKVLVHHFAEHTEAYRYNFQLYTDGVIVESRHFPDRTVCVENAYGLLMFLRNSQAPAKEVYLSRYKQDWVLNISDQYQLRLVQPGNCQDSEEAERIVARLLESIEDQIELIDVAPEERSQYKTTAPLTDANTLSAAPEPLVPETDIQPIQSISEELPVSEDQTGFVSFSEEVDANERFFFHFLDRSGDPLLLSKAFDAAAERDQTIEQIYLHGIHKEQYEVENEEEQYRFRLKNDQQVELAHSRSFDEEKEIMRAIFWLRIYFKSKLPEKQNGGGGLMINPASILNPKFSSGIIPQDGPCGKVFKPMEPLTAGDFSLFWGRDRELKDIYQLVLNSNLLLLYGAARSGKSSLVRCGLPNYHRQSEWHGIVVERRDNINRSFDQQLNRERKRLSLSPEEHTVHTALGSLQEIQDESDKPIFLIFDDIEELFSDKPDPEEQQQFFALLQEIMQTKGTIKAILIIDETYLAHLTNYETVVPNLFEHRYRLEKMSVRGISSGLVDCLDMLNNINSLKVPDPKVATEAIMERMSNGKDQIEVACMQIYLNELQQEACRKKENGQVLIDKKLIDSCDPPETMIAGYLDARRMEISQQKSETPEDQAQVRQQLQELEDVQNRCNCSPPPTPAAYPAWVSWAGWGLLLLLLLLLFWPWPAVPNASLNEQPTSCAQCEQYITEFGLSAPFGDYSRQQLASYRCQEWADCQIAQEEGSCETYIKYLEKYKANGSCSDEFLNAIIKGCLLPANTSVVSNCKLLTEVLPKSKLPADMLCLIYEEYIAAFGADNSCAQVLADLQTEIPCAQPTEMSNTTLSCTELRAKAGNNGSLNAAEKTALEQCACNEAFAKGDCNTYEAYLKTYGRDGRCAGDVRTALQELQQLNCPLPMGDICFLTATLEPVPWSNAHTQCPQGYKLICESQVRYLLEKFYKNDLRKSYSYMVQKIEATNLDFNANGYWTATEFSDSEAYAIEKDKANKSIKMPQGVSKSAVRPCLCIAPGPKFQESAISDLQCLSKSLSN
ncbi:ATP-binding protein [Flavilitoribacter nigricans]|uniref:Novel STAND NTPase 1 domain-containing protein n=1 Tax=Flavilitoribacter nigricans (strain ATCC 23147 / DSM 23189 / NBRC 102662 / NCIMB 1420 / SS-2) TaxID=1122177 RepID=A0A2D0N5B4_FLAN2|nr:ATP-binding protein [Flavilitoribacter nigricans]PHN03588.1 hypothetical protein CRP01_25335 [Flavilitoribacter nigricans DSM 23189 = NBRC 102662]